MASRVKIEHATVRHPDAFLRQKKLFLFLPAGITAQPSPARNDPVAGNDRGIRIGMTGIPNRTIPPWFSERQRDIAIRGDFPRRNFKQLFQDPLIERAGFAFRVCHSVNAPECFKKGFRDYEFT